MIGAMGSNTEPSTTREETTGDRPRRSGTGFDESAVMTGARGGAEGKAGG